MWIYISGPMTGKPDLNRAAFAVAAKKLRALGFQVISPPELDANEPCNTWEENLKRDLRWLTTCGAIATLPGWKKSRGANLEIHVGKALSYPVHTVQYFVKTKFRKGETKCAN